MHLFCESIAGLLFLLPFSASEVAAGGSVLEFD